MADLVDVKVQTNNLRYYILHLQCVSDGTGESAVIKMDVSTLTDPNGKVCTYTTVDRIEYQVNGFNYVQLLWDHTTDDEIATLKGNGLIDLCCEGGLTDPKSTGGTGDILLTSNGAAAGATYDITLWVRKKA